MRASYPIEFPFMWACLMFPGAILGRACVREDPGRGTVPVSVSPLKGDVNFSACGRGGVP